MKPVKGYEGLYSVTLCGRVWSHRRNKWMSQWSNREGYMKVKLTRRGERDESPKSVHRVVLETYFPNYEEGATVDHINKIRSDNKVTNLRWLTRENNVKYGLQRGYSLKDPLGNTHSFVGMNDFCKEMDLTQANISKVLSGERPHHKGWTKA